MPSAANAKSEKPASSEAMDNSPIRQIMTILEHKIRNLEKRKSKLTSYRDLQKAGKELNSDQKIAVAKYDEVAQTLEFARDLSKQVTSIAVATEREAKKQAKREAWVRNAVETNKIREVLLIIDCFVQMGNTDVRNDFLTGSNGAVKISEEDLKVLDNLYPEITPQRPTEEGQPEFHIQVAKAAEHLYGIIDGKSKEILGTTYTHIKEIVTSIHSCGYFNRSTETVPEVEVEEENVPVEEEEPPEQIEEHVLEPELVGPYPPAGALPIPPAPAVVPAPAYPLRPLPPITLQEVEHAYFTQQYPQQRPITEVIGSQNFFFLQESEIDSPVETPQPPIPTQMSPPGPIPTQTFTNQHFVALPPGRVPEPGSLPMPPQPHFSAHPEHAGFPPAPIQLAPVQHIPQPNLHAIPPQAIPHQVPQNLIPQQPQPMAPPVPNSVPVVPVEQIPISPVADKEEDTNKERQSPEQEEGSDRKTHGQGDGQGRYRRYGRGGSRGMSNGHRGRGNYSNRQSGDGYRGRPSGEYQNRGNKDSYQNRQYDGYQPRHKDNYGSRGGNDGYYGNGDAADVNHGENGGRDRYADGNGYQSGFKNRGRGGPRGAPRGTSRPPRPQQYSRKPDNAE